MAAGMPNRICRAQQQNAMSRPRDIARTLAQLRRVRSRWERRTSCLRRSTLASAPRGLAARRTTACCSWTQWALSRACRTTSSPPSVPRSMRRSTRMCWCARTCRCVRALACACVGALSEALDTAPLVRSSSPMRLCARVRKCWCARVHMFWCARCGCAGALELATALVCSRAHLWVRSMRRSMRLCWCARTRRCVSALPCACVGALACVDRAAR